MVISKLGTLTSVLYIRKGLARLALLMVGEKRQTPISTLHRNEMNGFGATFAYEEAYELKEPGLIPYR
ncbi:hypothetical protein Pyn_08213 [Prunus yedoensis var. nudiflora]|uniref:Uncharacterized protein n=1 Tax=Prunus yedoensis var. nudiflora TaxID=2094558 RepID=A0A314Z1F6_PRUYE|nr:hypothetical protein Pyn_08213 [Prunus yedoensis var. nudiflora]